jgi:hypothetical protein
MRQATRRAERHVAQLLGKVCKSARISAARHMIAAREVAVGRMIAAYRRGDSDATDYEIAWVTVELRDLRVKDETWARTNPGTRMRTGGCGSTWFGGRSPGTWRRPRPCSPWRPGSPVMAQCKLGGPR